MTTIRPEINDALLILRPTQKWRPLNLREIWRFRDLVIALATRDVKLRYRQTALGVAWVVLQPLIAAAIFAFVFGRVAKLQSAGIPYFAFAFAGMLAWTAFNNTLTKVSGSLVQNSNLVSKIFFPRLVLPISMLLSSIIDFAVSLVVMVLLMAIYRISPHLQILLTPIWFFLVLLFSLGIGLIASALMVPYRDVQYIIPVATQFLLYASPVAYGLSSVPARWHALYNLNPLSALLEGFRWSLLGTPAPSWGQALYATTFSIVMFMIGSYYFKHMERRFADVI